MTNNLVDLYFTGVFIPPQINRPIHCSGPTIFRSACNTLMDGISYDAMENSIQTSYEEHWSMHAICGVIICVSMFIKNHAITAFGRDNVLALL